MKTIGSGSERREDGGEAVVGRKRVDDEDNNVSRGRRDRGREHRVLEGRIGIAAIAKVERTTSLDGCQGWQWRWRRWWW